MSLVLRWRPIRLFRCLWVSCAAWSVLLAPPLFGQSGSLFLNPVDDAPPPPGANSPTNSIAAQLQPANVAYTTAGRNQPSPLMNSSWTYQPPAPNKVIKLHDIVHIRVDEGARMTAEGRASQRKNALYDGKLNDWLRFEGLDTVKPATQSDGDQAVKGQLNTTYRANSDVITRESLVMNIAAEVVDIRPNQSLVLEAHKMITANDNRWQVSLSGICKVEDIGPDNVILSKNIIDLKIDKREAGQARDGYRRGWFTEFMSRFQPF